MLSGVSLLVGWYFIRVRRSMPRHRAAMLTATACAGLFLVAYVTRWSTLRLEALRRHGRLAHDLLREPGPARASSRSSSVRSAGRLIYLAAVRNDFAAHRRLGRVTLPIWLYVAASGWLVYYMLYRMT